MLTLVQGIFIAVFLLSLWFGLGLLSIKFKMGRNAKRLEEQFIEPSGAAISQGMVRRREGRRGVVRDSQPSLTWYTRLFQ